MNRIRILLADDHSTVRQSLGLLLGAQADMTVVGEATDGRSAVAFAAATGAQVVVMDLSMPGMNGLIATREMRTGCPAVRVVALTRHNSAEYVRELFSAGASGYVLKQSESDELLEAIREVARGGTYVDSRLRARLGEPDAGADPLSPLRLTAAITERETEVLKLIAWGHSNKEIAWRLDISIKTVEVHRASAIRKLELRDRIDVVRYALLQGWLDES